jgi:hypothetical protein
MTFDKGRLKLMIIGFSSIALSMGCHRPVGNKDMSLNDIDSTIETHCVGQIVLDLPKEFTLAPSSEAELIWGRGDDQRVVQVSAPLTNRALSNFKKLVETQTAALRAQQHFSSESKNMLAAHTLVGHDIAIIRAYESPDSLKYFKSTLLLESDMAVVSVSAQVYQKDDPAEIETELTRIARLVVRGRNGQRKVCLGTLMLEAGQIGEVVNATFKSERWKEVVITVQADSMWGDTDGGLLKRWKERSGAAAQFATGLKVLRSGPRKVGSLEGEEVVAAIPEGSGLSKKFRFEVTPKLASFATPRVVVEMSIRQAEKGETGGPINSTDAPSGSQYWDSIVASIRM